MNERGRFADGTPQTFDAVRSLGGCEKLLRRKEIQTGPRVLSKRC